MASPAAMHPRHAPEPRGRRREHDERPSQVELLLDRERPEVHERAREDVEPLQPQAHVGEIAERREPVRGGDGQREERGRSEDEAQRDVIKRKDAQHAAQVEGGQGARPAAGVEQDAGDEKARENEEEIDAGPAGGGQRQRHLVYEERGPGSVGAHGEVIDEHAQDREAPHAVEGGEVAALSNLFHEGHPLTPGRMKSSVAPTSAGSGNRARVAADVLALGPRPVPLAPAAQQERQLPACGLDRAGRRGHPGVKSHDVVR